MLRPSRAEVGGQENVARAAFQFVGKLLTELIESLNDVGVVPILSDFERQILVINLRVAVELQRKLCVLPELFAHPLANLQQEQLQG